MERTTITVSDEVWRYLDDKKDRGDSMDDILRQELGLSDGHEEEHELTPEEIEPREPDPEFEPELVDQSSDIEEMLQSWRPGRDREERLRIKQDAIEGVEWVRDQGYAVTKSDVIAEVYDEDENDVAADSWWRKRTRAALNELAEQGVVEKDGREWRWVG